MNRIEFCGTSPDVTFFGAGGVPVCSRPQLLTCGRPEDVGTTCGACLPMPGELLGGGFEPAGGELAG